MKLIEMSKGWKTLAVVVALLVIWLGERYGYTVPEAAWQLLAILGLGFLRWAVRDVKKVVAEGQSGWIVPTAMVEKLAAQHAAEQARVAEQARSAS